MFTVDNVLSIELFCVVQTLGGRFSGSRDESFLAFISWRFVLLT